MRLADDARGSLRRRCSASLGAPQRRRRGGAGGRRRRAQRAPRRGAERRRYRDHRAPAGGDAARRRRRDQGGADRHRARHRHAGDRWDTVRGDDAARGRRDLRPQSQCGVRARLEGRRRAARLHHQRAVDHAGRHRARLCRRSRRSPRAPGSLHRRSGAPHRRGLPAHPALFPLPGVVLRRHARPRRAARLHRRARRRSRRCRANGSAPN